MHRFLIAPTQVGGSTIVIDDSREVRHIRRVLRLGVGDSLVCFDGQRQEYLGTISDASDTQLIVHVEHRRTLDVAALTLWLGQALPKAARFDWIVQKATELGVTRLSPLLTQRTVVRPRPEQARHRLGRWQRIAQAAAQQSGRVTLPQLDPPVALAEFLPEVRSTLVVMPTLAVSASPLESVLTSARGVKEVTVLIGPEGDFAPEEVALAQRYGAKPVSLGRLRLRVETAAVATLAMVRYALGLE